MRISVESLEQEADLNSAYLVLAGEEVSQEGIVRQLGGIVKDQLTLQEFRDAFKVAGWVGWDMKRLSDGIKDIEESVNKFLNDAIKEHDLKGDVPEKAVDSWIAWSSKHEGTLFLVDDKRFEQLKKSIEDEAGVMANMSFKGFVKQVFKEAHFGTEMREVMKKELKTFDDYTRIFSKSCERTLELLKMVAEKNDGELPKKLAANHYIGVNGLIQMAGQMRSSMRRAI